MSQFGFKEWFMINPYVIGLLLFFSVLMVTYLFERGWTYKKYGSFDEKFWKRLTALVQQGKVTDAISLCDMSSSVYSQIFKVGLEGARLSRQEAEDHMVVQIEECQEFLRKKLGLFGTLSFISPLLGLLGTVTGVLNAFQSLAISGSGGPSIVAAGISEALVTTAAGIVVAIPSAIVYNYFNSRLRGIIVKMNTYTQRLLGLLFEKRA